MTGAEREAQLRKTIRAQDIQLWKERVYDVARKIDPDDQHEWETLAYGFFLARGYTPKEALELAIEVPK